MSSSTFVILTQRIPCKGNDIFYIIYIFLCCSCCCEYFIMYFGVFWVFLSHFLFLFFNNSNIMSFCFCFFNVYVPRQISITKRKKEKKPLSNNIHTHTHICYCALRTLTHLIIYLKTIYLTKRKTNLFHYYVVMFMDKYL